MMALMKMLVCAAVVLTAVTAVTVRLAKRSTIYLPYTYLNGQGQFEPQRKAAEKLAYDPVNKLVYAVGDKVLHVINVTDPADMTVLQHIEISGMEFSDVEYCDGYVFTAVDDLTTPEMGSVIVYSASNQLQQLRRIPVGAGPDMLTTTSDCSKLIVAVEGQVYLSPTNQITDPKGLVAIINFPTGVSNAYTTDFLNFKQFDNSVSQLRSSGVRHVYQANNNPFSNDVEPEYIAISSDNTIAYVVLQDNNAVAKVDLDTATVTEIYGLGFKNWTVGLDPSDQDGGVNINSYNISGMYQPDGVVYFQFGGQDYLMMANEGSAKSYNFPGLQWTEQVRGSELPLDALEHIDVQTRNQLADNSLLGRLYFSTSPAGRFGDGSYRQLYSPGARSWSIRNADNLQLVYDSGDDIAQKTSQEQPDLFNCNPRYMDSQPYENVDKRSDNRGAEPESVAVGVVGGTTLLFIANERPGTILVYSLESGISQPVFQDLYTGIPQTRRKTWRQMYDERVLSDVDIGDIKFYPGNKSPTFQPVLFSAGSVSGTVSIIDIDVGVTSV